jgi:hypothetical protein
VLLIILLTKQPKAGAVLIIVLVVMGLFALILWPLASHRRVAYQPPPEEYAVAQVGILQRQQTESNDGLAVVDREFDRVYSEFSAPHSSRPVPPALPPVVIPQAPIPPELAVVSPIWSEGVEKEFAADIYPSKLAAARAGGMQLGKSIRELTRDANTPARVVVFQEAHEHPLIMELRDAVRRALPGVSCDIEAESRSLRGEELGITLYLGELDVRSAPWVGSGTTRVDRGDGLVQYLPTQPGETRVDRGDGLVQFQSTERGETLVASGQLDVNLSGRGGKVHIPIRFTEKPWVEDFAAFTSLRPERHFIVTRSRETCTSETEASQQAIDDARARLTEALGRRMAAKVGPLRLPGISTADVRQGGLIVDQFAQSFEGTAGRIWRHAILLDVSGAKLSQLADLKTRDIHAQKMTWARMGFSALGVVVLIGVIYFFLNMATMGYYEWSLRIAGVILAIVAVISILMIVQ